MAAKKPNDKLSKLDKRIAAVAPGKKYSDFTPAEKRKYDTNTARYVAELEKQRKTPTKSNKETLKSASTKKSVKATAKERGFAKDKASRKEMKQQDTFYGKVAKKDLKSGEIGISKSVLSKSQSPSKPKVPVKPRGGMRGGGSLGGGGGLSRANR